MTGAARSLDSPRDGFVIASCPLTGTVAVTLELSSVLEELRKDLQVFIIQRNSDDHLASRPQMGF